MYNMVRVFGKARSQRENWGLRKKHNPTKDVTKVDCMCVCVRNRFVAPLQQTLFFITGRRFKRRRPFSFERRERSHKKLQCSILQQKLGKFTHTNISIENKREQASRARSLHTGGHTARPPKKEEMLVCVTTTKRFQITCAFLALANCFKFALHTHNSDDNLIHTTAV